ncbi:MAG TPA: sucrase ferredoxin [Thermoanaerobaculia bacterium]|nr:sucrase ferredoxin [Thermoanaerobaculia bacterium]
MSRWCTDAARARGDDNTGTASRVDVWILVELPVTWGRNPIHDAVIPPDVRDALKRASAAIPRSRVVFIRKRVECLGPARVYIVRSAPEIAMQTLDLPSIDAITSIDFKSLLTQHSSLITPLVLICTHGQHDSCCGRRGYPLFDALRNHDGFDLWQCSHIGGDRFAANAVVLPWGLYYGPVETRDAAALAQSIARDEILLDAYRGRSTMSRPVQAGETFIRRATNIVGRDALRFVSREDLDATHIRVCFAEEDGATHAATIERYVAVEAAKLTCMSVREEPIAQFRLVGVM